MKEPKIRKIVTNLEEIYLEGGADMPVENGDKKCLKTVSVAAVIKNPLCRQVAGGPERADRVRRVPGRPVDPQGR